ncbi:MAG: LysR substrate-binding domain-containing protein [Gammaproteobacteria bacterium]|nr:LysR substrate-binding domain-containing protein [Gammaproteobacteria bacterium]
MPPTPSDPITDVVLSWGSPGVSSQDQVAVLREALGPICSPGYAEANAEVLNGPVSSWSELTFLDFAAARKVSGSWWDDWFEAMGRPEAAPRYRRFNSSAYLLEATIAGHGIALEWRGFIERHLETGTVVALNGRLRRDRQYLLLRAHRERAKKPPRAQMPAILRGLGMKPTRPAHRHRTPGARSPPGRPIGR